MEAIPFVQVYYADGEYASRRPCHEMARDYRSEQFAHCSRLLVQTVEHAGWSQSFWFDEMHPDGICVGTANDSAVFSAEAEAIRNRIFESPRNWLAVIRRGQVHAA